MMKSHRTVFAPQTQCALTPILILCFSVTHPAQADITLLSYELTVFTDPDGFGGVSPYDDTFSGASFDFSDSHSVTDGLNVTVSADYSFTSDDLLNNANLTSNWSVSVDLIFTEGSVFGSTIFSTDQDVDFSLENNLVQATGGEFDNYAYALRDVSDGNNIVTILDGSPGTGTLLAGRQYEFSYSFLFRNTIFGQEGVGSGNWSIVLDGAEVIPAPGAAILALVGFPLIGMMRRRKTD